MLDALASKSDVAENPVVAVPPAAAPPPIKTEVQEPKPSLPGTPPADAPIEDDSKSFAKIPELRREFNIRSKALKERETELQRIRNELETAKAPKDDPEKKAMAERISEMEKQLGTLDMDLRHSNYRKSPHFIKTFQKPYEDALAEAYSTISEFEVTGEDGSVRRGNEGDFMKILNLPLQQAYTLAKELFGEASSEIMASRRQLKDLDKAALTESKRYREEGEVRDKSVMAEQAAQREKMKSVWKEANESFPKRFPEFFATDDDAEGNKWLTQGFEYVDKIFSGNGMPPEERLKLEADVRNRAAGFGRLAYRLKKAQDELKETKEELAAFRESTPKAGSRDGSVPAIAEDSFDAMIDKAARK